MYELFEQVVARRPMSTRFANRFGEASVELPASYRAFVAARERHLPSNWELYSFFGHEPRSLDDVRRELLGEGLAERWVVFGKMADEDFLVFDRASPTRGAVVVCPADDLESLGETRHYASSFLEMIVKMTRRMASDEVRAAQGVLAELDALPRR